MKTTTNYKLNIVEGSDYVNPLTDFNPNFETIDSTMKDNADCAIGKATESYTGRNHAITYLGEKNPTFFQFTATSNYSIGDTFTFNGKSVTAFMPNGTSLQNNCFIINSVVLISISGSRMVIYTNIDKIQLDNNTPVNLEENQFLIQKNNKLDSVPLTPEYIGAIAPYKPGDSYTITGISFSGYISAGGTTFRMNIPLWKPVLASNVSVTGGGRIRQNGKYIFGTGSVDANFSTLSSSVFTIREGYITADLTKDDGFNNSVNNDVASFSGTLTITFS